MKGVRQAACQSRHGGRRRFTRISGSQIACGRSAAAIENGGHFEADISKNNLFRDKLVSTPYKVDKDGNVLPLEGHGIGLELDEGFLQAHPVIEGPSYV